jgi:leucine dehydrogenase
MSPSTAVTDSMRELMESWDGMAVVIRHDKPSDAWFFVALHDDTLGPPTGGIRMQVYPRPEDGLLDAMRLARGMTQKWAGVGLEVGGGKSVLALSRPLEGEERAGALRRFAHLVESLRGGYWGGEDMGTTPDDMAYLARETRFIHGIRPDDGSAFDPGPFTARGVLAGIRAAVEHAFGEPSLAGRRVLIQGVGDVGLPLARILASEGARVLVGDLDPRRAEVVAEELGGEVVAPEDVYRTECDVFAPCAVGAVLNADTIPALRCRIVAGSANNQLADDEDDARRLLAREIVYAPDYIVNAGGAIALSYLGRGRSEEEIWDRVDGIQGTVAEILAEAAERDESPVVAAGRRVERMLGGPRPAPGEGVGDATTPGDRPQRSSFPT